MTEHFGPYAVSERLQERILARSSGDHVVVSSAVWHVLPGEERNHLADVARQHGVGLSIGEVLA